MKSTWLSAKDTAEYLHMHPDTVRDLMRQGELQAIKKSRYWYTQAEWCDAYVMENAA